MLNIGLSIPEDFVYMTGKDAVDTPAIILCGIAIMNWGGG